MSIPLPHKLVDRASGTGGKRSTPCSCALHIGASKGSIQTLELGDVVLVEDETRPKRICDLARVVEAIPGKDGHIRTCIVNRADGTVVKRPVEKRYRLEIT